MVRVWLMLMVGWANAATVFNLNEKQVIETHLSSRDFNRIAIEQDRITQMFFDQDLFLVVNDEVNGQIFVRPIKKTSKHPLSFTITTEKNKTQDWLFTFMDVKARALILQDKEVEIVKSANCKEQAINLLNKLIAEERLKGMIERNKSISVQQGWELRKLKHVVKGNLIGHVLALKNVSRKAREITVAELWRDSAMAISIDRSIVEPGDYVRVLIVTDERGLFDVNKEQEPGNRSKEIEAFSWYIDRGEL